MLSADEKRPAQIEPAQIEKVETIMPARTHIERIAEAPALSVRCMVRA